MYLLSSSMTEHGFSGARGSCHKDILSNKEIIYFTNLSSNHVSVPVVTGKLLSIVFQHIILYLCLMDK
jgi:hypothetical protein